MAETNGVHNALQQRLEALLYNQTMLRSELLRWAADPRRSIEKECGHPEGYVPPELYQRLYDRGDIARRVVEVFPKECFQVCPSIYESEDAGEITEFEEAWDSLCYTLRGEDSWYQGDEGNPVIAYLLQADIKSGIGRYGTILLGLEDDQDLSLPAEGGAYKNGKGRGLAYLRCFPEYLAQITAFESDVSSPRFGQPLYYNLTFADTRNSGYQAAQGVTMTTQKVHWSRVVHISDEEVFGTPRMGPVLDRILDTRKVYGADAEGFWKNVIMRLIWETHPSLGGDVEVNTEALRDMMENMENGLQRWAVGMGMGLKAIAPSVVDPTAHINVQVEAICIQLGIPIRVFKGSERGELASSQDDAAWNDRLKQRQNNHITPRIIVPFVDRLIKLGVLPKPKNSPTGNYYTPPRLITNDYGRRRCGPYPVPAGCAQS